MANGNSENRSDKARGDRPDELTEIPGVGDSYARTLRKNGFETREDLQRATFGELDAILPSNAVSDVKGAVGDMIRPAKQNRMTPRQAKKVAKQTRGETRVKTVKRNGRQSGVVMRKEEQRTEAGMNIRVWRSVPEDDLPEVLE
jgi:nucleotidyltransferase/DNA polymerase involved in DNA repair